MGATFGRSFYVLDDYTPLRQVTADMLESGSVLFPVRDARWYVPRRDLGCSDPGCQASQGDAFWVAKNPDFGATFTYYLAEDLQTAKDARREAEKEREENNEDVGFPPVDTILDEQREDAPAIVFTVKNAAGDIIRHVAGPANAGFHRVAWDLRYPALDAWTPAEREADFEPGLGVMVAPGSYTVSMARRVDGVLTDLGQQQPVEVVSIRPEPTLPGSGQADRIIFEQQLAELRRAADGTGQSIARMLEELSAVTMVLRRARADGALYAQAVALQDRLMDEKERLSSNKMRNIYHDWEQMTVNNRLWHAGFAPNTNVYGPTPAQQESYRIARAQYDDVIGMLGAIETDYASLKAAMDEARMPWTPGR